MLASAPCEVAYLPCNTDQNRFQNIFHVRISSCLLPLLCSDSDDHTRVELKMDPELEESDYINASFIDVSFS